MATYTPHEIIALSVIFMILPLIAVALRAWAVRIRNGRFTADDYVIVAAMVWPIFAIESQTVITDFNLYSVALSASPSLLSAVCVTAISNTAMPYTELLSQAPYTEVLDPIRTSLKMAK